MQQGCAQRTVLVAAGIGRRQADDPLAGKAGVKLLHVAELARDDKGSRAKGHRNTQLQDEQSPAHRQAAHMQVCCAILERFQRFDARKEEAGIPGSQQTEQNHHTAEATQIQGLQELLIGNGLASEIGKERHEQPKGDYCQQCRQQRKAEGFGDKLYLQLPGIAAHRLADACLTTALLRAGETQRGIIDRCHEQDQEADE